MILQYDTESIELSVTKSKRKSLSIAIRPDGNVFVKAPLWMADDEILNWVKTKTAWIVRQRLKVLQQQRKSMPKRYITGERVWYLGQEYALEVRISKGRAGMAGIAEDKLLIFSETEDEARIQQILEAWYVKQAKVWIGKRVRFYAEQMQETIGRITIKKQKKRWGSCSSARNLNFNWQLMMTDSNVIDYVIVHELCHLRQMNHSAEFWREVENILPDYRELKRRLNEYGI